MSKLLDTLKQDRLKYRKLGDKHAAQSLTTLVGELETEAKRGALIDDAKVTAAIKKTIEGLKEIQGNGGPVHDTKVFLEIQFLESYLPKQLTEEQLHNIITAMNPNHIGEVMQHLKREYPGQFDGKLASQIAKKVLK